MKNSLLFFAFVFSGSFALQAQVTQINSNQNLTPVAPLQNGKIVLFSDIGSTLWVTDGTLVGTIQLSGTIKYKNAGTILVANYIFKGNTTSTGIEIFKTDGTIIGTSLVSDINPGNESSVPDVDFATLNGFAYFTASRPAEGREL